MSSGHALAFAVALSALSGLCLASRPPAGGVVLEIGPGGELLLQHTEHREASSPDAVGRGLAAGDSIGAEGLSDFERITGVAFFVLFLVALSCYFSGSCVRLHREARTWSVATAPAASIHVLHQGDEAGLRTAESVAATLRGLGCTVTGTCDSRGGEMACDALPEEADLVLCVLTPTIFTVDAAREELLRAKGLGIPVIPVHAGDQFPRDELTPMISCSPSELVARNLPPGDEDSERVHQLRKYVFRENIRDVDNMYHTKACAATVRLLAQRAAEAKAQRVEEVPSNHYKHDVFISYNARDAWEVFESIAAIFEGLGLEVFNPSKDLQRTEVSMAEMVRHVQGSRILIQVNTPHYASSKWCRAELFAAEEAGIPIHSVFAGKKSTGKQLLDLLNTVAQPGSPDREAVEKAKACILRAIECWGMVDAYNPDFAEEAVEDLGAIAYRHIAWLRWTRRLKLVGIGLTVCLLVAVVLLAAIMVRVSQMEKDCAQEDLQHLEDAAWLYENPIILKLDPGSFQAARECVHQLKVSRRFEIAAKAADHRQVDNISKTVEDNIRNIDIVQDGIRTITWLAYSNRRALEHFRPGVLRTAMEEHWNQTWLVMDASNLLQHFAEKRPLPNPCEFVKCLLSVSDRQRDDVRLQQQILWVLQTVVSSSSNDVRPCADRAFNACVGALRSNQHSEGVQKHGAACLRYLAHWITSPTSLLKGAVLAIEALQAYADSPVVRDSTASALLEMSSHSQEVRGWLAKNETFGRMLVEITSSAGVGADGLRNHTSRLLYSLSEWTANASLPGMDERGVQMVIQIVISIASVPDADPEAVDHLVPVLRQLATQPLYRPMLFKHGAMWAAADAISSRANESTVLAALQLVRQLADHSANEERGPELVREAVKNVSKQVSTRWDTLSLAAREHTVAFFAVARKSGNFKIFCRSMARKLNTCLGSLDGWPRLHVNIMKLWISLAEGDNNLRVMLELSIATKLLPVLQHSAENRSQVAAELAVDLLARLARIAQIDRAPQAKEMMRDGLVPLLADNIQQYNSSVAIQSLGMDILRTLAGEVWCADVQHVLPDLAKVPLASLGVLKSEVQLLSTIARTQEGLSSPQIQAELDCVGQKTRGSFGNIMAVMRSFSGNISRQIDTVALVTELVAHTDFGANITAVEEWAELLVAACQAAPEGEELPVRVAANIRAFEEHWQQSQMLRHVLPLVLGMMRNHSQSQPLQVLAVNVLRWTAADSVPQPDMPWVEAPRECATVTTDLKLEWLSRVRAHIGTSEVVPLVLQAMEAFPFNMVLQVGASSLLDSLALQLADKLVEAGAIRYLLPRDFKVPDGLRKLDSQSRRFTVALCTLYKLSRERSLTSDRVLNELKIAGTADAMTIQGQRVFAKQVFVFNASRLKLNCEQYFGLLGHLAAAGNARTFMVQRGFLRAAKYFLPLCSRVCSTRDLFIEALFFAVDGSTSQQLVRDGTVDLLQRLLPEYHGLRSTEGGCTKPAEYVDLYALVVLASLAQLPGNRKQMLEEGAVAIAYVIAVVLHPRDAGILKSAKDLLALLADAPWSPADPDRQLAGAVLRAVSSSSAVSPDIRLQAETALKLIGEPTEQGVAAAICHSPLVRNFTNFTIPETGC